MGDNRTTARTAVLGLCRVKYHRTPLLIYWSSRGGTTIFRLAQRGDRLITCLRGDHLFQMTRWERTFRLVR